MSAGGRCAAAFGAAPARAMYVADDHDVETNVCVQCGGSDSAWLYLIGGLQLEQSLSRFIRYSSYVAVYLV